MQKKGQVKIIDEKMYCVLPHYTIEGSAILALCAGIEIKVVIYL